TQKRPHRTPLFPYTTLFRSNRANQLGKGRGVVVVVARDQARRSPFLDRPHAIAIELHLEDPPGARERFLARFREHWSDIFGTDGDRKSTRLNSSHRTISYAV